MIWVYPCCEVKVPPISLYEVRFQELNRAYLLLLGECNRYNKLYNEINVKYANVTHEIQALKSRKTDISVNQATSRDSNQKEGAELHKSNDNNVIQPQVPVGNLTNSLSQLRSSE